ncbi:MAG: DUF6644 family protein [Steroidobacteraceae bacterium]
MHGAASVHGFAEWLQASAASQTIKSVSWIVPLVQSIHIVTIGVVFVSSLMIALRVLGGMRADEPFEAVWRRFAPWMWTGLAVMAATGLTLITAEPVREFSALSFWLKMLLLAITVTGIALYGHALRPAKSARAVPAENAAPAAPEASATFSPSAKAASVLIVALWIAIIFLGRAIAYDGAVWGSLSPHG